MSTVKQVKKPAYGCMDMLWSEYRELCYGAPSTVRDVPLGTVISAELGEWSMSAGAKPGSGCVFVRAIVDGTTVLTAEGNSFKDAMDYMRSQLDRLHCW